MELKFLTAREIWADYNPAQQPLNASTISSEVDNHNAHVLFAFDVDEKHVATADLYFDDRWQDKRAAVLLLRHCDGRDVSELVQALLKDGYIVCVPDYSHISGGSGGHYSSCYPECLKHLDAVETSVYDTPWYVWCKLARRCITALCGRDDVAIDRVGAVGIGTGADLAFMVAGSDNRIAALVAVDGGGYRWARGHNRFDKSDSAAVSESESVFSTGVGAETYARSITCPVLMLCPQLSRETDADRLNDTLSLVKTPNKQHAFMHCADYQLTAGGFKTLMVWLRQNFALECGMNYQPTIRAEAVENSLYLRFNTIEKTVKKCIYVSVGEPYSAVRRWRLTQAPQKTGEHEYSIKIPISDPDKQIIAYANFTYSNGVMASTPIIAVLPSEIGIKTTDSVIEPTRILYDNSVPINAFISVSDSLVIQDNTVNLAEGPFGINGVTAANGDIVLIRSVDEMASLPDLTALHFDAYTPKQRELAVRLVTYPDLKQYTAYIQLDGGDFWQKLLLDTSDFKSEEGRNLPRFSDVKIIAIADVKGAVFNNFLWI